MEKTLIDIFVIIIYSQNLKDVFLYAPPRNSDSPQNVDSLDDAN